MTALCDELEARIEQGKALSQQLLESTVHHLLTGEVRPPGAGIAVGKET